MAEKKATAPTPKKSASAAPKTEVKSVAKAPSATAGATAAKAAPAMAAPAKPAPAPVAPAKPVAIKPASVVKPASAGERARMVAEAAFFIAEKRGFVPGRAEQDWAEAERQIATLLNRI